MINLPILLMMSLNVGMHDSFNSLHFQKYRKMPTSALENKFSHSLLLNFHFGDVAGV